MIQTLIRNWWLLALCGLLEGIVSALYLIMQNTGGPVLAQTWGGTVIFIGKLAMAAGACAIGAALWRSKNGISWALTLNGLALAALGFIQFELTRLPIGIFVIELLIVLIATSIGVVEFAIARSFHGRGHRTEAWLLKSAAIVSFGFILPSLALGLQWIRMQPGSHADLLWLGLFFGFTAICSVALAIRLHRQDIFLFGPLRP